MLKKISVIFIVYMMLITGSLINVSAEEYNGFEYSVENNEVTIKYYTGTEKNLKVPSEINGYKVTKIDGQFFAREKISNYIKAYTLDSLTLPDTLKEIVLPVYLSGINSIVFEGNNDNFYVEDGCIYSKDKETLYYIPKGLKKLTFKSETKIANMTNLENTELESLVVPSTVDTIFGSLELPNTLKVLEMNTNYSGSIDSKYLTKLTFGNNIKSLENLNIICDSLSELSFSEGLKSMPTIYSDSLKNINLPASVDDISHLLYSGLSHLENVTVDVKNKKFKSDNGVLYQNNILNLYPEGKKSETYEVLEGTTEIYKIQNTYLKNLKLPNSLTTIDERGLANCESLETLNIPQNITTFYEDENWRYVLIGCNNLKKITVDDKNKNYTISNGALYSKDYTTLYKWFDRDTKNPEINGKTKKIGISAFDSCNNIESINLKNVTDIVYGAFTNCKSLKKVDYSNVQTLGLYSFMNCTSLKEVKLPDSLSSIGASSFRNCESLENLYIPQNINTIYEDDYDNYIFANCDNLNKVTVNESNKNYIVDNNTLYTKDFKTLIKQLDKNVETFTTRDETDLISTTAFNDCKKLKNINTNNVTEIMYGGFANCDNLKDVLLPKVTELKGCVFAGCNSLKTFKMPNSLKRLSSKALFANCNSLENIDLNNVTYLDIQAFMGCSSLKSVIIPKTVKEVTRGYWDGYEITCKFYVYKNSDAQKSIDHYNYMQSTWQEDFEKIKYEIVNEYESKGTNIKVQLGASNVDENTELKVEQITNGKDYDAIANYSSNFSLYDIGFYKNNEKVEIDGTAIVRIPLKEGMDGSKCKVYYNDNGTYIDMNAEYKEGYMEFKTDHFSQYVLTDNELPTTLLGDVNEDGEINFLDAIMVLRHDAEIIELEGNQLKAADVNKDGEVNFLDAIMILRYDAEIIDSF